MPWVGLRCVIVVFPDHTHLLYEVVEIQIYPCIYCSDIICFYKIILRSFIDSRWIGDERYNDVGWFTIL